MTDGEPSSASAPVVRRPLVWGVAAVIVLVAAAVVLGPSLTGAPAPTITVSPGSNPIGATVESIARGNAAFLASCAVCHGTNAKGDGPQASSTEVQTPALAGPGSHLDDHDDAELFADIQNGLAGGMPPWRGRLSDDEIWDIINFLRSIQ